MKKEDYQKAKLIMKDLEALTYCAILKRMKSLISRFIILTQRKKRKYTTVTAIYLIGFNQKQNRRKYGQIFIQGKKT